MNVEPCPDKSVAAWLLEQPCEWFDLITSGPLGYEAYVRLRFIPDPAFAGQDMNDVEIEGDGPSELWHLAVAVETLSGQTSTPEQLYFLIWDGWPDSYDQDRAAEILLEDEHLGVVRRYHLFTGDSNLFAWESAAKPRATPRSLLPDPAFIWPADRAWCIADDIDPHFATIAATRPAVEALRADTRIDVTTPEDRTLGPPRWY